MKDTSKGLRAELFAAPRRGVFEGLALIALIGVGAFLRGFRLDHVPLGLLWDEAYNASDALRILHGARPIFLTGNFGREAMLMYFQAIGISLFGQTDLAMRLPSALAGILTLPASWLLARRLFGPRIATLAVAWLALSPWHVILSRLALRTVLLPLAGTLGIYFLWRGLEATAWTRPAEGRERGLAAAGLHWFGLSGAFVGLSLYTYIAARFIPIVVLALAFYVLLTGPRRFRRALSGFVLCGAVATLVFAPEGLFFLRHPDAFFTRARAVSPVFDPTASPVATLLVLGHTALRSLGIFSVAGDPNWAWSVSGQPIFDPLSSALLVLGSIIAIRRVRDPAHALIVIWIMVMLVPTLLTDREVPNNLRVSGVIPAIFVLPSLGADWLWRVAERRGPAKWRRLPLAVACLAGIVGTGFTYNDYFGLWAHQPDVSSLYGADRWLAVENAGQLALDQRTTVFVGAGDADGPFQRFLMDGQPGASSLRLFDGTTSLIFPADPQPVTYVFSARDLPSTAIMTRYFPGQAGDLLDTTPGGQPVVRFRLSDRRQEMAPAHPLPARFGDQIQIYGFDAPREATAGQSLTVRWYWRLLARDSREWYFFNQLFDGHNQRWGQTDGRPFSPDYWPTGTTGISTFEVKIDPLAETGAYWLEEGVYDRASLTRLTVFDGQGRPAGGQLRIGPIKVHGRPTTLPRVENPRLAHFGDQIDFVGYGIDRSPLEPGQTATMSLFWRARARPSRDYTVFVQLVDATGKIQAQGDAPPAQGDYPTSVWDAGEVIGDRHRIDISPTTPPGTYRLLVGLYVPRTGRRLPLLDDAGKIVGDHIAIEGIAIGSAAGG